MKHKITLTLVFFLINSASNAAIKIQNNSLGPFTPELKFITAGGTIYQCNQRIPLLQNQGEPITIPTKCFTWGDETGYLYQFIGVQPGEPDAKAFCPEFTTPYAESENVTIIFQGVNPEKHQPANGVCSLEAN